MWLVIMDSSRICFLLIFCIFNFEQHTHTHSEWNEEFSNAFLMNHLSTCRYWLILSIFLVFLWIFFFFFWTHYPLIPFHTWHQMNMSYASWDSHLQENLCHNWRWTSANFFCFSQKEVEIRIMLEQMTSVWNKTVCPSLGFCADRKKKYVFIRFQFVFL